MQQTEYLFAYGTLRKEFVFNWKSEIANGLLYTGNAIIKASLYDLGSYPGAVKENEVDQLTGDVFSIINPEKVFTVLDEYEGSEYERKKVKLELSGGQLVQAWIYWYNKTVEDKQKIGCGDYLIYLKTKASLV